MSELLELIKSLNIPQEKLSELASNFTSNPLAAMASLQSLNISPETLQKMVTLVMANPESISELGEKLGVPSDTAEKIKHKIEDVLEKKK